MESRVDRRILVLVNPKSGIGKPFGALRRALDSYWDKPGVDLYYQFSQSTQDGVDKAERAVESGIDTILVSGGDGTVNSIGRVLVETDVALGVIPTGSGNGFARHFGIPLSVAKAVKALAGGISTKIDVGLVDGKPFFVTCSMAWDASIVRSFEKWPVRGIIPYIFAGVQEFFEYTPQQMTVTLDTDEVIRLSDPLFLTIANLSEYGGGARIAPRAVHDDGRLELVTACRRDAPMLLANVARFFDGSIERIPGVDTRSFKALTVSRQDAAPIQVDGEIVDAPEVVSVEVLPRALRVLVPALD